MVGWSFGQYDRVFDQVTKTKPPQPPAAPPLSQSGWIMDKTIGVLSTLSIIHSPSPAAPPSLIPEWVAEGSLTRESTRDVRVDFWTLGHFHRENVQVSSVQLSVGTPR